MGPQRCITDDVHAYLLQRVVEICGRARVQRVLGIDRCGLEQVMAYRERLRAGQVQALRHLYVEVLIVEIEETTDD